MLRPGNLNKCIEVRVVVQLGTCIGSAEPYALKRFVSVFFRQVK